MTGTATHIKLNKNKSQVDGLSALIESSPAPIFIASVKNNHILQVNQAFARLFAYNAGEVQGMPVSVLFSEPEYHSVIWNQSGSESVTRGDECLLVGKEGNTIPAVLSSHTIDLDGQVCSFTILHDISEQYRASAGLRQSEERFSLALKGAEEGVWDWDVINDSMYYSARMEEMLGYREGELDASARTILGLIHPRDVKLFLKRRRDFLHAITDRFEVEFRVRHKKGHYICILSRGFGVRDENGRVCRVVGTHLDISERKRTEKLLSANERRFRALYDDSPAMFFTLDKSGKIRSVNRYGAEQLGTTVESLFGRLITEFIHDEDKELLTQELQKFTNSRNKVRRLEFRLNRHFGEPLWVRAAIRPIINKNRKSYLMTCEDISEARILSEHLEHQAKYDSLTGLVNRSEFERRLRQLLMHTPENMEHALCYLDLDQFKVINDTCGHLAGDEMLRRLAALLTTVVRKRDTLARLGGDEFAVLLEHCPFYKAREIAENLLDTIKTFRFEWQGKHFSLGASIGLVPVGRESGTLSDILSTADSACYAAKDAGRNRVHIYNVEDDELSMRRSEMQWVAEITNALEENRFQLAVQPIVSLQNTGNPDPDGSHYEILIRMEDKDGNLVMPGSFLPAAEKYNLSGRLDQWVVDHVFSWLKEHPQELEILQLCSINLSGLSMSNPQFMNYLVNKFDSESAIAKKICLEVTETAAITHLGDAIKFMNLMKEIGCSFSLDDFGTGLSSFGYLKNLPVDFLKIDGSFIRNIAQDATDQAMVRSINEIGQVMGKATIAEFVENDQILNILKKIGVNYAQGYGIGRPILLRDVKK